MGDDKEKLDAYYRYYESEYAKIIGLSDLERIASEKKLSWLVDAAKKFSYRYSSVWRHEAVANTKYLMTPRKVGQICTTFKISRRIAPGKSKDLKDRQVTTTYSLMYSHFEDSKIVHDFVALSPTYRSADGEYRHRFVPVKQILDHRNTYSDIYNTVEQYLADQAKNGDITLQTTTPGLDPKTLKKFQKDIDAKRFLLMFYAAEWFPEFLRKLSNRSENHLVEGYHDAMFGENDIIVWNKHKDFLENEKHSAHFYQRSYYVLPDPKQNIATTEVGQKIVPLTVRDIESADDIRLAPWREMYITGLVGDLIVNGICPGVPILGDWFFVEMSPDMFDNAVSHAKIKHSEVAADIIRRLEEARRQTYLLEPIRNKEIYLSYRMEGLSEAVEVPMNFAEREIVLSKWVLVAVEEHLGRTVGDLPGLMMFDSFRQDIGPIFLQYSHFAKYMFEFMYSLVCLNEVLGVIHGDPHINNITIFKTRHRTNPRTGTPLVKNPHILYRIGYELYLFPTVSKQAAFIDFSRGFIWNREILAKDHSESQIDQIKAHYQNRIIETLLNTFPDYMNLHRSDVELALDRHFDLVYRVFQVVDTYRVMHGWEHLIQNAILAVPKRLKLYADRDMLTKKALPLIIGIKDSSYRFFVKHMNAIIGAIKGSPPLIPAPNRLLLVENFKSFVLTDSSSFSDVSEGDGEITLVDYWSDQNQLQYNIREYDNFPPTVKFDYAQKHKIAVEDFRIKNYNIITRYQEENDPVEEVQKIAEEEIEAKARRRGTPESLTKKEAVINEHLAPAASTDDIYYSS